MEIFCLLKRRLNQIRQNWWKKMNQLLMLEEGSFQEKNAMQRRFQTVNPMHKSLLHAYNRANIGPAKTYHLLKEQYGSYENTLIKDSNAHVFIDNFKRKQEVNSSFNYAYEVDGKGQLKYIFWAYGKIIHCLGNVVSFDTTYESDTPYDFEDTWKSIMIEL
ncbi:hypothetical protein CR513_19388, partial [Mucuna pruriens]